MSDKLPSIDDFYEELPSIDEIIKEEKELPSVDEFVEKEEEEIEDATPCSLEEEAQDLTEIVRLINDVRKDIPNIPEIKYYDEELEKLSEQVELVRDSIPEIPEIKYYDEEIASLREEIDRNAADIPEIKYYDEQVNGLEEKIKVIKEDIVNLPEPKYYEADLKSLKEDILAVKESVPAFPKWVNEVNEVPDFSWIGKTFGVIDSDFVKVNDGLDSIRGRIDQEIQEISENFDLKDFENKVEFEKVTKNLKETKANIYKELREAALKIHETKHSFKNDDRLLKKQILSKYNVLKQRVEEEVKEFNRKNEATKDLYGGYFEGLTQEIANLPTVKYYDEDIERLSGDVKNLKSLYLIVEELKEKQKAFKKEFNEVKDLQEGLLNEPNDESQSVDGTNDPLTPLDKQFPNLKSLADHYRLFISRTQQQIATIGGGGAGFIKDLADVSFTESTGTNKLLIYDGDGWVGIASTALSPIITLHDALGNGNVSGIGISVGVVTATNGYFSGIVTAAQLNYDVVTDIYSTGIVTATKGIQVTTLGLNVASGISTLTDGIRVGSAATIKSNGNATFSGIVTASSFVGDGTGLTGVASTDNIQTGTPATFLSNVNITGVTTATGGVHVGTAASIFANGNITAGIITATSFTVAGTSLAETIADTVGGMVSSNTESGITVAYQDADNTLDFTVGTLNQDTTGNAATATALETARNIGGVSFDGSASINLPGVNTAGDQDTSGNATTATTATTATNITVSANNSNNETVYPIFVDGATGGQGAETDTGLTYNPSDGNLTSTTFTGALTGNVTGNTSGSSGSCTGDAAGLTGTPNITVGSVTATTGAFSGDVTLTDTTTDSAAGPELKLFRNSASPADADYLGQIKFAGESDTGTERNYAKITGKISDASNGTEDGIIEFAHIKAGSQTITGRWKSTELQLLNDTDLSVAGDTTFTGTIDANSTSDFGGTITLSSGQFNVGTAATIFANGNVTAGIVTASSFIGDGSGLTGTGPTESDTAVSSTSATSVLSFAHASYRSASIIIQVTQGSAYQSGRYMVIHDGTTASIIEESAIATGSMLATFTTAIVSSNLVVYVNMGSSSSATVTVLPTKVTV